MKPSQFKYLLGPDGGIDCWKVGTAASPVNAVIWRQSTRPQIPSRTPLAFVHFTVGKKNPLPSTASAGVSLVGWHLPESEALETPRPWGPNSVTSQNAGPRGGCRFARTASCLPKPTFSTTEMVAYRANIDKSVHGGDERSSNNDAEDLKVTRREGGREEKGEGPVRRERSQPAFLHVRPTRLFAGPGVSFIQSRWKPSSCRC